MGPASGKCGGTGRQHRWQQKCWWLFWWGLGTLGQGARSQLNARQKRFTLYCVNRFLEVASVTMRRWNVQDAKIRLQLKPRRLKSRLEIPQTSSRELMLNDEGKSVKSLTALQEFVAQLRPSQIQIWVLQSRAATAAWHTIPQTLLFLTIKLPKPPLKWILTYKFHCKATNWSFCALSCSTNVPFRVA